VSSSSRKFRRNFLVCVGLVLATLIVYWPVRQQEFVNFDDPDYVTNNPQVQKGITAQGIGWAFTTTHAKNWHPLTWLSHMLDCQLFGLHAGAHKLVNVGFHIGSTLLLFLVLNRMTAAPGRSAFVAAVFALHPLHVESVAWVAERKDVLCAFFWMLTLWAYVGYVRRRSAGGYARVLLLFFLALLAKPTAVTLPFVLLLLDIWPLKRVTLTRRDEFVSTLLRLIREKWLLFLLSAAACVLTYWAQSGRGLGSAVANVPLRYRVANAAVAYVRYLNKTLWPVNLAVFYPHPGRWETSTAILAMLAVVGLTVLVIRRMRGSPFLAVGWLWYLGTLLPMIGLVQVGGQSIADRYSYVPMVGLLVMIAWGIPDLIPDSLKSMTALSAVLVLVIIVLMCATRRQLRFWQDSIRLFEHALAVTEDNYIAHNNLGFALLGKREFAAAAQHFQSALTIWPEFPEANKNLADMLAQTGRLDEAVKRYQQAIQGKPNWAEAHNNLGLCLARQGKLQEAVTEFSLALQLEPNAEVGESNLALALTKLGRFDEAFTHASRALQLNPQDAQAHYTVGVALENQGQLAEAAHHYTEALRIEPNHADAQSRLAKIPKAMSMNQNATK
jgi:protein O-mannosyl-transferase